jgi:peroxiredoxin
MSLNGQTLFNPQADRQDAKCFAAVATQMDQFYPDALRTVHLHNVALKGMSRTSPSRYSASQEAIGKFDSLIVETGLIEIELPDCKGRIHKLSDQKGKVVLLDFTAFKTSYATNYNMMLRTLYNKYSSEGLAIYQVSVDSDESYWSNIASNLPWICVRDESSVYSSYLKSYNVRNLPSAFLIDREGNIVDRPDNTDELEGKIAKLLELE